MFLQCYPNPNQNPNPNPNPNLNQNPNPNPNPKQQVSNQQTILYSRNKLLLKIFHYYFDELGPSAPKAFNQTEELFCVEGHQIDGTKT